MYAHANTSSVDAIKARVGLIHEGESGRFHAAVTLRANRLDGIEREWPREVKALASWRDQPRFAAWWDSDVKALSPPQ